MVLGQFGKVERRGPDPAEAHARVWLSKAEAQLVDKALLFYSQECDRKILESGRRGEPMEKTHDLQRDCLEADSLRIRLRGKL